MTDALSHYLPAFTVRRAHLQKAVCGVMVDLRQHSTEPACAACQAWLEQEPVSDREGDACSSRCGWCGRCSPAEGRP